MMITLLADVSCVSLLVGSCNVDEGYHCNTPFTVQEEGSGWQKWIQAIPL